VIALTPEAETQVDRLIAHYEAKGRLEAVVNLLHALERAKHRIARAREMARELKEMKP
jgi:plasmid stabilization system protein ParE